MLKLLVDTYRIPSTGNEELMMIGMGGPSTKRKAYCLYTWVTLIVLVMMLKHVDGVHHDTSDRLIQCPPSWI